MKTYTSRLTSLAPMLLILASINSHAVDSLSKRFLTCSAPDHLLIPNNKIMIRLPETTTRSFLASNGLLESNLYTCETRKSPANRTRASYFGSKGRFSVSEQSNGFEDFSKGTKGRAVLEEMHCAVGSMLKSRIFGRFNDEELSAGSIGGYDRHFRVTLNDDRGSGPQIILSFNTFRDSNVNSPIFASVLVAYDGSFADQGEAVTPCCLNGKRPALVNKVNESGLTMAEYDWACGATASQIRSHKNETH